jgi:hypothetical protein
MVWQLRSGKEESAMKDKYVVMDGWYQIAGIFDTWEEARNLQHKKTAETKQMWFIGTLEEYNQTIMEFARAWSLSMGAKI